MTNKEHIENVINRTFKIIKNVYDNQQEKEGLKGAGDESRIIFPKKRENKKGVYETRISEQELRFVFVEQLNNEIKGLEDNDKPSEKWDVYYSVETPTMHGYTGFKIGQSKADDENGQSGNIDLTIHDKQGNRICLIEFKALNPKRADYQKDFCKLVMEDKKNKDLLRYFIQIVENVDSRTMRNIREKIYVTEKSYGSVSYKCYCLDKGEEQTLNTNLTK